MTTNAIVPVAQPVQRQYGPVQQNPYQNNPYIQSGLVCYPINQVAAPAMPMPQGVSGLGAFTQDDAKKIINDHISALPDETKLKIIAEGVQGKFDTISNEVGKAITKICTASCTDFIKTSASSLGSDMVKWVMYVSLSILGLWLIKKIFFKK